MTARIKNALVNAAIVVASTMLGFLCLEFSFRWSQGEALLSPQNFIERRLDIIQRVSGPIVHDELLGWSLIANYRVAGFSTGFMGIRQNGPEPREPRKRGILAVGDSFTHGSGVQDQESWPAYLEKLVGVPVYNAAAGGWGVDQIVLRAEQLLPHLEPTTVVVGIMSQDSLRNNFSIYAGGHKPYFELSGSGLVLSGVPVPKVHNKPLTIGFWRRVFGHSLLLDWTMNRLGLTAWWASDALMYQQFAENKVGVEISCRLMDRLLGLRAKSDVRVIVVMQYGAAEASAAAPPWYAPPVLECAENRGIEWIDTYEPLNMLSRSDPKKFLALWLDEGGQPGHMSASGNAFIASLVHKAFKK